MVDDDGNTRQLLELTAEIVTAHVSHNSVHAGDLPNLIAATHAALAGLGGPANAPVAEPERPKGAVSARKSLADPSRIVSMIDGKGYSSLTRHLKRHGYTKESYREAFNLPADYPMIAPAYADKRREIAKTIGLGRKKAADAVGEIEEAAPAVVAKASAARRRRRR